MLLTVAVVIVARFVWVFPAIYLPRWLSPKLARRDPAPPWQWAFFLAFVGVRGVVSLAAALAIPLTTLAGAPFAYRDLILFVTFGVLGCQVSPSDVTPPSSRFCPWSAPRPPHYAVRRTVSLSRYAWFVG